MSATAPVHQILVSATLVAEEVAVERALSLRALPPARFRKPIRLKRLTDEFGPELAPRARRRLAFFTSGLAVTSVAIAAWNVYCLASPLRDALAALLA